MTVITVKSLMRQLRGATGGVLIISVCALSATNASAQAAIDGHPQMTAAARLAIVQAFEATANRIEVELPPADPRLQVPVCALPLETSMSRHNGLGGRVSVKLDCRDAAPWSRHVAAQVRVFREVVVASRNMTRGATISTSDISVHEVDVSTIRGQIIESAGMAIGMVLRRATNTGDVLSMDMLITPLMVKRGDSVVVTAERAGVVIRQQGVALQDGETGKQIQVRNTSSDRIVHAIVTGMGEATVIF